MRCAHGARRSGLRSCSHARPVKDLEDVFGAELETDPDDLKTEATIAAIIYLLLRSWRKRSKQVLASYRELRTSTPADLMAPAIERWAAQQLGGLSADRFVLKRALEQRYEQFSGQLDNQLARQISQVTGAPPRPRPRRGGPVPHQPGAAAPQPTLPAPGAPAPRPVPGSVVPSRTDPTRTSSRAAAARARAQAQIDQVVKLSLDLADKRVRGLVEQIETTVTSTAIYTTPTWPPAPKADTIKKAEAAQARAATDIAWSYQTAAAIAAYEEAGIEYATWTTQGDDRVRPKHKAFSGRVYKLSEGVEGIQPGEEINCRCYPVPKRPGFKP